MQNLPDPQFVERDMVILDHIPSIPISEHVRILKSNGFNCTYYTIYKTIYVYISGRIVLIHLFMLSSIYFQ